MNDDLTQTIDEFVQDVEEEEQMDKQGEPTDTTPPLPSTRGVVRGGAMGAQPVHFSAFSVSQFNFQCRNNRSA